MITPHGYSNDASIVPEGIVITWTEFMYLHPWETITRILEDTLKNDLAWPHKLSKKPKHDVLFVYIIRNNEIVYRCNYGGWIATADNYKLAMNRNFEMTGAHIILTGPIVKPPASYPLKGFRGFRYCTELF